MDISLSMFLTFEKWWNFEGNVRGGGNAQGQCPDDIELVRDQCVRKANNVHGGMFSGNVRIPTMATTSSYEKPWKQSAT